MRATESTPPVVDSADDGLGIQVVLTLSLSKGEDVLSPVIIVHPRTIP
jgi:hypothetical protein